LSEAKHTPGPWTAEFVAGDETCDDICICDSSRNVILEMTGPRAGTAWPNAHLIAASPDLLAIAESLEAFQRVSGLSCECGEPSCRTTMLRAAIAKARGAA
jgi:hypothetical protein